jgi:FkbM family methyltransferase
VKQNLIYDVGLHKGEDTDFYLKKGFQVVAIEANAQLIAHAKIRFREALMNDTLRLIEGAIAPASEGDKIIFYATSTATDWGTTKAEWILRNEIPTESIEVNRVDIAEIFRMYGIPFYLKIDIEGSDRLVLEELKLFSDRPRYVSLESEKVDFNELRAELDLLKSLGYTKFKLVQQQYIPGTKIKTLTLDGRLFEYVFERYASGPFGADLPPPWFSYDDALEQYKVVFRHYKFFGDDSSLRRLPKSVQMVIRQLYRMSTGHRGPLPGWFDTHASP